MNRAVSKCVLVCLVSLSAWAALGCTGRPDPPSGEFPRSFLRKEWPRQEVPVAHIIRRDYRLREGDQLEIIYHVQHVRNEFYRIKIQDIIVIRFPFHAALNQTEQVQSDGTLHLDLVGSIYVFDKTIDEVHKVLVQRYAKYLKKPEITVSFKESNVRIAELKQAITTAPRGQSRLVPITPDGTISLPFVVDIAAAGRTIGELHKTLNAAYRAIGLDELEVTVNVQTVAPLRVFVLGEVNKPGAILNGTGTASSISELTLLQALAQAGSYIPARAELSKVMLVRRRHLPRPNIAVVNVFQLLENRTRAAGKAVVADASKYRYDIWLEDGDIVYVPTTAIAKRADYIDYVWTKGIRAVGGFTSQGTYNVNDPVDWLGPNP
jgi:protein involved in polysaccharide export with SLBB domain